MQVKVEPRDAHERVVKYVLVAHHGAGEEVGDHVALVVRAEKFAKHTRIDGQEGLVLNIRIILNAVADHVVHIVRTLPPAEGNPPG